jgi:hypothetical protein
LTSGIVTDLLGNCGQAMGLNVFTLFTDLGLGALIFQALLSAAFPVALGVFGVPLLRVDLGNRVKRITGNH